MASLQDIRDHLTANNLKVVMHGGTDLSLPQHIVDFAGIRNTPSGPRFAAEVLVVAATVDSPDPSDDVLEAAEAAWKVLDMMTNFIIVSAGGTELLDDAYGYGQVVLGSRITMQEAG